MISAISAVVNPSLRLQSGGFDFVVKSDAFPRLIGIFVSAAADVTEILLATSARKRNAIAGLSHLCDSSVSIGLTSDLEGTTSLGLSNGVVWTPEYLQSRLFMASMILRVSVAMTPSLHLQSGGFAALSALFISALPDVTDIFSATSAEKRSVRVHAFDGSTSLDFTNAITVTLSISDSSRLFSTAKYSTSPSVFGSAISDASSNVNPSLYLQSGGFAALSVVVISALADVTDIFSATSAEKWSARVHAFDGSASLVFTNAINVTLLISDSSALFSTAKYSKSPSVFGSAISVASLHLLGSASADGTPISPATSIGKSSRRLVSHAINFFFNSPSFRRSSLLSVTPFWRPTHRFDFSGFLSLGVRDRRSDGDSGSPGLSATAATFVGGGVALGASTSPPAAARIGQTAILGGVIAAICAILIAVCLIALILWRRRQSSPSSDSYSPSQFDMVDSELPYVTAEHLGSFMNPESELYEVFSADAKEGKIEETAATVE
jgi:hypothetical protein